MFTCVVDCFLASSVRSYCSRPFDQAVECGADDESTPSGAIGDCVSVFPMFLVALVGHTLARPTRWSTWSFFSCDEHPAFGIHLLGSLFGIMQLALPECVAGIFVSLLLQAASHILLLSHFSPFPIHRSYALVCSCVDVDVKLTDTHWACPLGSNKI